MQCGWGWGGLTNLKNGNIFSYVLGTSYDNFQQFPIKWNFEKNSQTKIELLLFFFSDPRDFQEVNNIPVLVNQLSGAVSRITQLSKAAAGFQYLLNSPFATGN